MKIIFNSLIAVFLLAAVIPAQAQGLKLAHVNITKVLETMPEYKATEKKLQEFATQLQDMVSKMEADYAKKVQDYYELPESTLPVVKEAIAKEITDLENRIIKLRSSSEDQLVQKQVELLKPLEDKVMAAIKAIAAEKGISYVFDSSTGSNLLYSPPADDITELVKAKLAAK